MDFRRVARSRATHRASPDDVVQRGQRVGEGQVEPSFEMAAHHGPSDLEQDDRRAVRVEVGANGAFGLTGAEGPLDQIDDSLSLELSGKVGDRATDQVVVAHQDRPEKVVGFVVLDGSLDESGELLRCGVDVAHAFGGRIGGGRGLDLALMCDVRVASTAATFGQPQVRHGIPAAYELLAVAVGDAPARELCLTGRVIASDEAHRMGLVARVVAPQDLIAAGRQVATDIASVPAAAAMKQRFIAAQPNLFASS